VRALHARAQSVSSERVRPSNSTLGGSAPNAVQRIIPSSFIISVTHFGIHMHHGFSVGVVDDQTILVLLVISGRGHFLAIRQPDAITGRRLRTFQWGWGQTACTSNIIQATAVTKIPQNFALAGVADTVDMLGEALHSQDRVANASYGPAGSTRPPPHLQRPAPVRSGPVSRPPPHFRDRHQSAAAR